MLSCSSTSLFPFCGLGRRASSFRRFFAKMAKDLTAEKESPLQYLKIGDGRNLAYRHTPAADHERAVSDISVLFLPGWVGSMNGEKAIGIEQLSRRMGWECARFDYEAVGESPGNLDDVLLSDWKNNALSVFDQVLRPESRVILVGSSMGGWLSMHLARNRRHRVAGIVAIAPALDFLSKYVQTLPKDIQMRIAAGETVESGSTVGKTHQKLSKRLLDDTIQLHLMDLPSRDIRCPVRILHGMRDETVPWRQSLDLINHLESDDVELILRKAGDHRLSSDGDIFMLTNVVDNLVRKLTERVCKS